MEDLLAITTMHPMRQDAIDEFLARAGADWSAADAPVAQKESDALRAIAVVLVLPLLLAAFAFRIAQMVAQLRTQFPA